MENDQEDDNNQAVVVEALRQQGNDHYKQGASQSRSLASPPHNKAAGT